MHADIREYIDQSDVQALAAPRVQVVETGKQDGYSALPTTWVGSKQVARHTRAAYGDDAGNFVHYLHYDAHYFHVGDAPLDPANPPPGYQAGVQVPTLIAPQASWSLDWQTDGATRADRRTLFDYLPLGPPPIVATIAPKSGATVGGSAVTITGTEFLGGATVRFGNVAAKVTIRDDRTISAIAPAQASGTVDVVVANPDGQAATLAGAFTYGDVQAAPDTRAVTVTPPATPPVAIPAPRGGQVLPSPTPTSIGPSPRALPSATGGAPQPLPPRRP